MIFYHNITKCKFNITDIEDLVATFKRGDKPDILMYSKSGDAQLYNLYKSRDIITPVIEKYLNLMCSDMSDWTISKNVQDAIDLILLQASSEPHGKLY